MCVLRRMSRFRRVTRSSRVLQCLTASIASAFVYNRAASTHTNMDNSQLTTHTSFSLNSPDEISWAFDIRFDRHLVCGEVVKW